MNNRKPGFWLILAAVLLCAAAAVCFLTNPRKGVDLAERIDSEKDRLTEQIGTLISEAEAGRYSVTDWKLIVARTDGKRADCFFGGNWKSIRKPEEDPMVQGMYWAADNMFDATQKRLAQETADAWLSEMRSEPEEEYREYSVVIILEGQSLEIYYPLAENGEETLIPLQEYADTGWTEDAEKRYQDGISMIEEAVGTAALNLPDSFSGLQEGVVKEGINHYNIKGYNSRSLLLDEVEWVTDSARAAALGLDADMPGGFYLYNETESQVVCFFAENCAFIILDWQNNFEPVQVDRQEFLDTLVERADEYRTLSDVPFIIEIEDGEIISVREQYLP